MIKILFVIIILFRSFVRLIRSLSGSSYLVSTILIYKLKIGASTVCVSGSVVIENIIAAKRSTYRPLIGGFMLLLAKPIRNPIIKYASMDNIFQNSVDMIYL
jgi:hypothetical protein